MCKKLIEDSWNASIGIPLFEKIARCSELLSVWGEKINSSFIKRINNEKHILKMLKGSRDVQSIELCRLEKIKLAEVL